VSRTLHLFGRVLRTLEEGAHPVSAGCRGRRKRDRNVDRNDFFSEHSTHTVIPFRARNERALLASASFTIRALPMDSRRGTSRHRLTRDAASRHNPDTGTHAANFTSVAGRSSRCVQHASSAEPRTDIPTASLSEIYIYSVYIYIYIYIYICICVYIYICICIYIYDAWLWISLVGPRISMLFTLRRTLVPHIVNKSLSGSLSSVFPL